MQCIRPLRASYSKEFNPETQNYGISFSPSDYNKELQGFQFPCRKCLPCRLNQAREKGIRSWHESQMHEESMFLTLTYSDQHLKSPKLQYEDWQKFAKKLRKLTTNKLPIMVTGEYGEQNKRPHFHALIYGFTPADKTYLRTTERGDRISSSSTIDDLWGKNDKTTRPSEIGDITIDSANYVARYAAKKLVHGHDDDHDYHPIHKTSSRYGIGRSWIEKYYRHTFENGYVLLPNLQKAKIPRYYVDWARIHQPESWLYYVTEVLPKISANAELQQQMEDQIYLETLKEIESTIPEDKSFTQSMHPQKRSKVKETILKLKFKRLQENLKL